MRQLKVTKVNIVVALVAKVNVGIAVLLYRYHLGKITYGVSCRAYLQHIIAGIVKLELLIKEQHMQVSFRL